MGVMRALGFLVGVGRKTAAGLAARGGPASWSNATRSRMTNQLIGGLAIPSAITWATAPPEERSGLLVANAAIFGLTAGMAPLRQTLAAIGLSMAPQFGDMLKGVQASYRSGLDARTSLAVPFGHSSLSMDLALAQMQYASQRVGGAYRTVGGEAAFMAARYASRG